MLLVIDNYDSFVYNLARYFQRLGQETVVVRNDAIDVPAVRQLQPAAIVFSPGPCRPAEAGCCVQLVRELHRDFALLGICLGHQAIAEAWGADVVRAAAPRHGRTSCITHVRSPLFEGIPSPLQVCRYHSLVVDPDSLPPPLRPTATTAGGTVMALEHRELPVMGVQFHPEALLTEYGYPLLANFLRLAGLDSKADCQQLAADEYRPPRQTLPPVPGGPITF